MSTHATTLPGQRFCTFEQALPEENLSTELKLDKWELMPYNTIYGGGTMLLCRGNSLPKPVLIRPNLKGWQRIYVCLVTSAYPSASLTLKLKGDYGSSFFCKNVRPNPRVFRWNAAEIAEEYYWECADMTDEEVTIEKLADESPNVLGVLWLRFEPMTEAEVAAYKVEHTKPGIRGLHAHTDLDWIERLEKITPDMFAPFVHSMANSDAELLSVEFYPLLADTSFLDKFTPDEQRRLFTKRLRMFPELAKHKDAVYNNLTRMCHEKHLRVYAALRHSLGVTPLPFDYACTSHVPFASNHPEYYCLDRDGETIQVISLAYEESQDYLIGEYIKMLDYGFDGITMFFHRGIYTLFEQPVLDLCAQMFDGLDARKLPLDDERLMTVHCELLTRFVRRMRAALDNYSQAHGKGRLGITIIGNYTLKDNRVQGIDIARWAEEGLIDNLVVANMDLTEDDNRFLDEGNPGLLDIEKYKLAKFHEVMSPVHRNPLGGIANMSKGIPEYKELTRRTGLQVYYDVPWECTVEPEYFREYAIKLYEAGAEHLSLWDCFHTRVMNRAEWNVVSMLGHADKLPSFSSEREDYGRSVRVLSFNNNSIACFHPAWRG